MTIIFLAILLPIIVYGLIKLISYLKAINWQAVFEGFSFTQLLGRLYFVNMFLMTIIIDIIYLACFNFQFNFGNIGFLIGFIILAIITVCGLVKLITSIVYNFKLNFFKDNIFDFLERVCTFSGVPRCGKTSSSVYMAVLLAKKNWHELKREYWQIMSLPFEELSKEIKENKDEIIKAYNYFQSNIKTRIPCLYSFCAIYKKGRQSYELTKKMLLKEEPLMYKSVIVVDEISSLFPNQNQWKGTDKKENFLKVADFGKYIGQYIDGYMLFTEQNFGNSFKNLRDVCGLELHYPKSQKWVCRPTFLLAVYNVLFSLFDWYFWEMEVMKPESKHFYNAEKALFRSSKRFGRFMNWLWRLIRSVGYRKYSYQMLSLTNGKDNSAIKEGTFYLPSPLNARYNDRYFRNKYECFSKSPTSPGEKANYFPSPEEIAKQFED